MQIRTVNPKGDIEQLKWLWRDAGWDAVVEDYEAEITHALPACSTLVAEDASGIGCAVLAMEGEFQFMKQSLPLTAILGVLTAPHVRRRGWGARTLSTMLSQESERGAIIAALGVFDEGYYDRLGFGSCGYDPIIIVDPALLCTPEDARHALNQPNTQLRRITVDDAERLHATCLQHPRAHGTSTPGNAGYIRCLIASAANKGLGIAISDSSRNSTEEVRAYFFGMRHNETQLEIMSMYAHSTHDYLQILETIHNLSDQLEQVRLPIPSSLHIHDLLKRPLRDGIISPPYPFDTQLLWQLRILDLPRAIDAVQLPISDSIHFRLRITDPIENTAAHGWSGCGGDYEVVLGQKSHCRAITSETNSTTTTKQLPLLDASIGAFSRFWSGAIRPSVLCNSDRFHAPATLIDALDTYYCIPTPQREWEF